MNSTPEPVFRSEHLLGQVTFRRFWLSRFISQTAQAAVLYGLLILIVDKTDASIWSSIFVVCSIIPSLLLGLVGGIVADWLPQRGLMIVLNLIRAGFVALLVFGGTTLTEIFIVTLGIWTVHQFYSPAESAIVPRLVAPDRLASATSLYNFAVSLAQLTGMVLLAPLLLKLSAPKILFSMAATLYGIASILLIRIGQIAAPAASHDNSLPNQVEGSLRTGWRVMVRDRISFAALVDSVLVGVGLSALVVIVPEYLERVLDTGADNSVYVFAPAAFGLFIGLQVAPVIGKLIGHGRLATIGLVGFAISIGTLGAVDRISEFLSGQGLLVSWIETTSGIPERISTTMLLAIPAGFATSLVSVSSRIVLLQRTPDSVRARVFSTQMTLSNLGALAPTLLAGLMIDLVGVQPVALVIALALLFGAIFARRIGGEVRTSARARSRTS